MYQHRLWLNIHEVVLGDYWKKALEERTWRKGEFWDESGTPNETSQQQVQRMEDNRRM